MPKPLAGFFYLLLFAFFGCFFFIPIWDVIQSGFFDPKHGLTCEYIRQIFQNPIYIEGLLNALIIGTGSTIVALVIAIPLACLHHQYDFYGKKLFSILILLPLVLPPFVGVSGFLQLFGTYGTFNAILRWLGWIHQPIDWVAMAPITSIILVNAFSLYPILYLNLTTTLSNIDPTAMEAAENLGCKRFQKFWKILLPMLKPGVFAGCTIVFIWSFTELGVPLMFNFNRVTSVQLYHGLCEISTNHLPYALTGILFLCSTGFYLIGKLCFGRNPFATSSKASHVHVCNKPALCMRWFCIALFTTITVLALLPHLAVILFSIATDWYQQILPTHFTLNNFTATLSNAFTTASIQNSLIYSFGATCLNVFLGIIIAFLVVRTSFWGRQILDACAMLPLTVPSLVIAFGLLSISQKGKLFECLNPTQNPTLLLIIAYTIRRIPLMVRAAVAGLQQIPIAYAEAAYNMGCHRLQTICKITLPLMRASLIAGFILVFSQSMLEVSDSLILAQKKSFFPITKAIYELLNFVGDGRFLSCALGVWTMTFLMLTLTGTSKLLGKRFGNIFKI